MNPELIASMIVVIHLLFVLFVLLGGLLVLCWNWLAWLHIPAAIWGVLIEFGGWICPLTPLENHFRGLAGEQGYSGGFVEHYLIPILYPAALTMQIQWILGSFVLLLNLTLYFCIWRRRNCRSA